MPKEIAVLAVHGMGKTKPDFDAELKSNLRSRLGKTKWSAISWHAIYYQGVLQNHQSVMMKRMRSTANIDGIRLREFLLYSFSDAASIEARPDAPGSVYEQIQELIVGRLDDALAGLPNAQAPVVIIAQSLGCQVMSNYLWDAQARNASVGVFRDDYRNPIGRTSAQDKFRRLKTLRYLFTSGCNIPIFVAGRAKVDIKPVKTSSSGWQFRWQNYYDPDDVLGWPLHPINPAYRAAVHVDDDINVGGIFTSWNPLSHKQYWDDKDFLNPVEDGIRRLLS